MISIFLPHYHLAKDPKGGGRKKKEIVNDEPKEDSISQEYRTHDPKEKWPGRNLGD